MAESIRVVVDWTCILRRNGGGDMGASSVLCLRFAGFAGDAMARMIPRRRLLRSKARMRLPKRCADFVLSRFLRAAGSRSYSNFKVALSRLRGIT
jgi:hypothetical protein